MQPDLATRIRRLEWMNRVLVAVVVCAVALPIAMAARQDGTINRLDVRELRVFDAKGNKRISIDALTGDGMIGFVNSKGRARITLYGTDDPTVLVENTEKEEAISINAGGKSGPVLQMRKGQDEQVLNLDNPKKSKP